VHEWCDGRGRVGEQCLPVVGIHPRSRDGARSNVRADRRLVRFDDVIQRGGLDIALLDEHGLDGAHPQLDVRRR
jgi:hypothetical protein